MVYNIGFYKPKQLAEFHKLISMVVRDKDDKWLERLKANDADFADGQLATQVGESHVDNQIKVSGIVFDTDDEIQIKDEIAGYTIELIPFMENEGPKENVIELGYLLAKEFKAMEKLNR